jgi:glycosyltransferase involved in cell wall biosynthesis
MRRSISSRPRILVTLGEADNGRAAPLTMRIAVIEPLPVGGLLHYATQLADALAERGNSVDLVLAREHELADRSGPARRRAILPPDPPAAPPNPTRAQRTLRRARTAARLASTWLRIAREVRFGDYDAILLGGSFDMALTSAAGLLVARLKGGTPLAHVCHNVRPFNRWGGDHLYVSSGPTIALLRRLYPSFDLVFVHGEQSRREFEATWPPTRLAIIPHGDERLFSDEPPPPAGEARVLFFGAWRKMKGLPVLMQAFDALAERRPEVRLTVAGPTVPEEGESERVLAWAAERSERVEALPGYVPMEDVAGLFARARVVVLPYLAGYQSGVVHLAMTMGRAVVVTAVGDLPEAVADGTTGLVVASRDPDALADALERVLADAGFAERLGAAGHARMLDGSGWPEVAERVETGLRSLNAG